MKSITLSKDHQSLLRETHRLTKGFVCPGCDHVQMVDSFEITISTALPCPEGYAYIHPERIEFFGAQ